MRLLFNCTLVLLLFAACSKDDHDYTAESKGKQPPTSGDCQLWKIEKGNFAMYFSYDEENRLRLLERGNDSIVLSYNTAGDLESVVHSNPKIVYTVTNGKIVMEERFNNGVNSPYTLRYSYTYDNDGRVLGEQKEDIPKGIDLFSIYKYGDGGPNKVVTIDRSDTTQLLVYMLFQDTTFTPFLEPLKVVLFREFDFMGLPSFYGATHQIRTNLNNPHKESDLIEFEYDVFNGHASSLKRFDNTQTEHWKFTHLFCD